MLVQGVLNLRHLTLRVSAHRVHIKFTETKYTIYKDDPHPPSSKNASIFPSLCYKHYNVFHFEKYCSMKPKNFPLNLNF